MPFAIPLFGGLLDVIPDAWGVHTSPPGSVCARVTSRGLGLLRGLLAWRTNLGRCGLARCVSSTASGGRRLVTRCWGSLRSLDRARRFRVTSRKVELITDEVLQWVVR